MEFYRCLKIYGGGFIEGQRKLYRASLGANRSTSPCGPGALWFGVKFRGCERGFREVLLRVQDVSYSLSS